MLAGHTAVSAGLSPPHACKQRSWELQLGLIFSLVDVVTGNWVLLDFSFREAKRSITPVEDGGDSAPDPNALFDQMLNSIRVQPEPPASGE